MKKLLSLILSVCLISSFSITGLALDTADYELKGASVTLDGTKDQTVEISLTQAKEKNLIALEGSFSTKETEETNYVSLSEFKSPVDLTGTNYSDVASGKIVYVDSALEGYAVAAGGAAMTVVYTVSKDTPAGKYTVQFNGINVQDYDFVSVKNQTYTAEITVTRNEPSVTTGYTVALSSNAPSAGVAKEGTFKVNLDVTNSDSTVNKFNAFSATLSYSKDLVSYTGGTEISGFEIDNKTDGTEGTLKITKEGEDVSISKSPDLELPFTAKEVGSATFTLQSASVKVDVSENAEKQDAPEAQIAGSPLTVTIIEATPEQKPVVTNVNGDTDADQPSYTGSGEQTQYQKIVATIDTAGYIPTYDGQEMYLVEGEGYAENTYYYVIKASETYDKDKLGYKEGTATTIEKDNDVNQTTHVDINDAQFVYNIYNDGAWPTKNEVVRLILADTNRNGTVDTSDCVPIIQAI